MGEAVDLADKIKRYYKFTPSELKGLAISAITIGFIISFREWGVARFNAATGIINLFNAILIVTLSILVHDMGQRVWGLAIGYRIEFRMWTFGLVISLMIAFISNGKLWVIVPGGFMLHHLSGHRLGWFRYGINYFAQGMVAFAGSLFTLMLIIFLRAVSSFSGSILVEKAIMFNVIYLITSLLPLPPLDGSKIMFGSRMMYAFTLPAILITTIMLIIKINLFLALVLSLIFATILWIAYYICFERKVWKGP